MYARLLCSAFSICTYTNEQNVFSLFYKSFFYEGNVTNFHEDGQLKLDYLVTGYVKEKKIQKPRKKIKLEVLLKEATYTAKAKN